MSYGLYAPLLCYEPTCVYVGVGVEGVGGLGRVPKEREVPSSVVTHADWDSPAILLTVFGWSGTSKLAEDFFLIQLELM